MGWLMKRPLPWLTGLVLALGLIHLGVSALALQHWSEEVLWFAGSGLAILTTGLLNVAMTRAESIDRVQKAVWVLANLATALFFGAAWTVLPQPQVIVGGFAFALLAIGAAIRPSGAVPA